MKEALRRSDVESLYGDVPSFMALGLVHGTNWIDADAVILGMPHDGLATLRGGATRCTPQEIHKFSLLFGGYSFDWDLDIRAQLRIAGAGDGDVVPGDNTRSYARVEESWTQFSAVGRCRSALAATTVSPFPPCARSPATTPRRSA